MAILKRYKNPLFSSPALTSGAHCHKLSRRSRVQKVQNWIRYIQSNSGETHLPKLMKNIFYKDTTVVSQTGLHHYVFWNLKTNSLSLNKGEKPPSPLQAIKINTSPGMCRAEVEHLDELAEPLLFPSHRWGMGQSEALSGSAGLQSGNPCIFWLCAHPKAAVSADQTSTENLSGEEEALPQMFPALHPSHPIPSHLRSALQRRTPQGAAASSAPELGMDGITADTVDGITSQTPFSQLPAGWFPCRSLWQALEEQQSSHPVWPGAPAMPSLISTAGCTPRWITEAEPGCCQLSAEQEVRKACPSWFPPRCQAKPVASHQLHPQSNPCSPPDDHICFPNILLTDTCPAPELCVPMSAHNHLWLKKKIKEIRNYFKTCNGLRSL